MSPAKRTGKSPDKAPSTAPPVSPPTSPTDLRTLAQILSDQVRTLPAELQTARDDQDRSQRAEAADQQAYKSLSTSSYATRLRTLQTQAHDQAMEIQGREHRAASRSHDLRLLLVDQAVKIRDLTGRLDRISPTISFGRWPEIHQLQSRIHGLARDLEDAQAASVAADESLDRLRDELRLTQEEVVINDFVGFAHGGSVSGSARGGSPALDQPSLSSNVALARLSDELKDAKESIEKLSAGRDYALEEFVRMTKARDEIQDKLTDTEL
ncbi:hypothetical protein PInf_025899 [Phytophthora infestans]|nr:hypothetical protein PInf_025899 [Phytophthora infestans]